MIPVTPDGTRYLALGAGRNVPRPFMLRWLLPSLLGQNRKAWAITSRASIVALAPLAWWYTGSPWMAAAVALPSTLFAWRHPVLVDAPAMALTLLAACLWPLSPVAALAVGFLAVCCRETAPVWLAVWAWTPAPLVLLLVPLLRWGMRTGPDPCGYDHLLAHPLRTGLDAHRGHWFDWRLMLAPWGGLLIGLAGLTPALAVALVIGYAQTLLATDTVRLYQWAWPSLALACVAVVPAPLLPFVALAVALNPWKGSGL